MEVSTLKQRKIAVLYIQCTFLRDSEHAMTTLINTYSNIEFRINLQDLHFSTWLINVDVSLNHRYFQIYHTMVDKNRKLSIQEKKLQMNF